MGPEKIWLRFWAIFLGQVQNDLKQFGNRLLGSDLNFLEKCQKWVRKELIRVLGNFSGSGAE